MKNLVYKNESKHLHLDQVSQAETGEYEKARSRNRNHKVEEILRSDWN